MSTEEIISAIFDRTAIWNSRDINHKNKRKINQLWEEIKNELNIEVAELRKKWKNLKDSFRKELKKIPTPRSGDAGYEHNSSWQYFDQMCFMRDEIVPFATESNLNENHSDDQASALLPSSLSVNDSIAIEEPTATIIQNVTTVRPQEEATTSTQRSRKRRTANDIRGEFLELEKKRISLLEKDINQSVNLNENKTEDYYFFMSLLPQMEKLSPIKKYRVRQKINQAIMDELNMNMINESMSIFDEPSTHYNTQP